MAHPAPQPALRIIDANLNRAREALRTMEDAARFALNDPALARRLKDLRHDLRALDEALPADTARRLATRDTPGDVGTAISTPREGHRAGLHAVAAAAGARLTEALRSIEEHAKCLPPSPAPGLAERARYQAYEADRLLGLALAPHAPRQWRLCVLITESLCTRHWREAAEGALRGGADCVQLREKDLPAREIVGRARVLLEMAASHGASVVVNDRVDLALAAGAHGVHLGQSDLPLLEARALAGHQLLIGVSCTTIEQARRALAEGADGIGLGPMFPTDTKPRPGGRTDGSLAGQALLSEVLGDPSLSAVPHLAIGGITPDRIAALPGCRGVAVCAAVCRSPDPEGAARALREAIDRAQPDAATTLPPCP